MKRVFQGELRFRKLVSRLLGTHEKVAKIRDDLEHKLLSYKQVIYMMTYWVGIHDDVVGLTDLLKSSPMDWLVL